MKYVILSPAYGHHSAGIRVLFELQKHLIRAGRDAIIISNLAHIEDDDVAIYPEVISGNPLNAKRVVRYILNVPGKLGGDATYPDDEIRVAYNKTLAGYADGHILQTPCIEPFFTDHGVSRDIPRCFWVGKGAQFECAEGVEITHAWPPTRKGLADLLNRSVHFFTSDGFTALAEEAKRCGCQVWLASDSWSTEYPFDYGDEPNFPAHLNELLARVEQ